MRVVLETTHLGAIGGGENYLNRLASALNKVADFYVVRNWPKEFVDYNGFGEQFKVYNGLFEPDIYLYCSHFAVSPPIGRRNLLVCFFPKQELHHKGYDACITLCGYSAGYVGDYWGIPPVILEPCIDSSLYRRASKERKILTIGHFFEEPDGHSKQQHVLASAFTGLDGYELVQMGNANPQDWTYVNKVKRFMEGKNGRVETNKNGDVLKSELSTASHLWHGCGYGRTDPGQTEHFGIIVLEAIASGAVPIVHKSGGAQHLTPYTWERPEELRELTLSDLAVPPLREQHTVEFFNKRVEEILNDFR